MAKKLTKRELTFFKKLLLAKRALATGEVTSITDTTNGQLNGAGGDEADLGSGATQQDFALSILENEANVVREIDDALERIDAGTYGICMKSGKPISKARLEAIPWAKLSVECQREEENGFSF